VVPDDPSKIQDEAKDPQAVRLAAVAALARRDFASAELRQKLGSQGYDAAVIEAVVAELIEKRVLNDARYVESYVAHHAERGQGPVRITAALCSLGISLELIDLALSKGPDWQALAHEVRQRKFGSDLPETPAERALQARFLQYRGFSSDHIRAATGADLELDSQT